MSVKIKRGPHNLFVSYVPGEVEFRKKHFKSVDDLYKYKDNLLCSICSCSLESSILKGSFSKHPALGVLVCDKCLEYYGDGLFSPDEEGEDKFCRWCAQGGELYCCSKCVCTFCKKCVYRHFKDNKKVLKSLDEEDWQCFLCVSKPIWFLRALCWAVYHFKDKFVKKSNDDGDGFRLSRHKSSKPNKRSRSTSSEEEESSVSRRNESQRKHGPRSKTRSEPLQSGSSSDEDFKKKPERPKRKRNGRDDSGDSKPSKNKKHESSDEDEDRNSEKVVRKKTVGPKSRTMRNKTSKETHKENSNSSEDEEDKEEKRDCSGDRKTSKNRKHELSDEDEDSNSEKVVRKKTVGPKSRTMRNKRSKENSDSSEDEEDKEEKRKHETEPIRTVENNMGTRTRKREENKKSNEEESIKTKTGPKSKVGNYLRKTGYNKSEDEMSDEDGSSDEKSRKTKPGPKSRVKNPVVESENEEKFQKTKIGPKSKVQKSEESLSKKTETLKSEEEEKNNAECMSSDEMKSIKAKIGPKSKIQRPGESFGKKPKTLECDEMEETGRFLSDKKKSENAKIGPQSKAPIESERSSRRKNKQYKEEESSSEDEKNEFKYRGKTSERSSNRNPKGKQVIESEEEEEEDVQRKSRKTNIGPKSRVDRRTGGDKNKESSEEDGRKTREDKGGRKVKKVTNESERDVEKSTNGVGVKPKLSKTQEDGENSIQKEVKTCSLRAVEKFQTTLELCENLAMEIQRKTEKLKKLASESKFSSARNTHKIYNLLNEEMKKNSRLFLNLSELVEDHIGGVDAMFELDNQTLDILYDQATLSESKTNYQEIDDVKMAVDDSSNSAEKTKKKRKSGKSIEEADEVNENVEDSRNGDEKVGISAILSTDDDNINDNTNTDEETNENKSKNRRKNKNKKDSEVSEKEDERMDDGENVNETGISLILTSDEDITADNKETDKSETDDKSDDTKNKKEFKNKSMPKKNDSDEKNKKGIPTSDLDLEKQETDAMDVDGLDETELGTPKMSSTRNPVGIENILTSDDEMSVDEVEAAKASVLGSEDDSPVKRSPRGKFRTPSKDTSSKETSQEKSKSKSSPKEKSRDSKPATIDSILTSDSDDNGKDKKENENKDPEENEATALSHILSSSEESEKDKKTAEPSREQESEYYSLKSEAEMETNEKHENGKNNSKRKEKRRNSCKEESQSEREKKETDSGSDEGNDEKKNESESEGKDKKKRKNSISASVEKLTGLSSLEKPNSNKSDASKSKSKKKEDSDTPKSQSKKEGNKDKSLLEFLNEEDSSSAAEELEERTELLSSLIKEKSEEAKKQNEEMIKQALLRADDESNKEENSSELESDDLNLGGDNKTDKSKKVKKEESEKKLKKEHKDSSSDSDGVSKKKKKGGGWRNDPLLKGKLSDTDTSEGEKKFEAKMKKEGKRDTITLSSDEELAAKKESSGDDSDCFVIKKKKMNKRRGRLRDSSDSSDVLVISSSNDSSHSSDDDFKKKKDQKKKRSRIKKIKDSDESGSDSDEPEELNASQGTPGKGRKNIRHILTNEELAAKTITASKSEEERKKRIEERQTLYNKLFKPPADPHEKLTKLVLDFDEKTRTELISVHPDLVSKLKPHQVEGVRFMFNACFESVHQIKKNKKGSGCILAHCMGLGKTLQVVTLVHTLMTHQDVTKVGRVMVVTPLNTVANWVDEFHNWLKKINNGDDVETFNLIKAKKDYERSYTLNCWFEEGGVLIIGYEMFRNLINKRGLSKKVKTIVQKTLLDPGPDLVVCDEGHILKNEASAVSKAMCQIRTLRRIILTGTPLQNNLEEYHCMVQFIKPNLLGDKKEFKNRFANPINNGQYIDSTPRDVKIMKRRAHVLFKMLDGIVQRKDYNVLTPFLPPKYEYVISIKLTELQIKLYSHYLQTNVGTEDAKPRLFADYQALKLVWTHPYALKSASLTRQRREDAKEAASDSEGSLRDFIDDDDDGDEKDSSESGSGSGSNSPPPAKKKKTRAMTRAAKQSGEVLSEEEVQEDKEPVFWWTSLVTEDDIQDITNSNKLLAFMFVLKQCEEIGDKLLVFSQSLETLSLLEYFLNKIDECTQDGTLDQNLSQFQASWTLGLDYFRLDGSSSSEDRSYWVKSFNNPSNLRARLFLISTKAGGLGINLVAANRVIIFDVSWNPSHDIQSIFRVFRFGQTKPSYIYRFLAQGTMEEKIYDRQVAKQSMSCRVVDEQQIDRHFTRSDIHELYEFKPDEKKDRKIPALPKDRLMAEMIKEMGEKIVSFHEHDSLLENVEDEELNEEERKAAWEEFESEKSRPAMSAGATYVNNLIMQNNFRQQQAGMVGAGAANLKLDSQHMLNFLKNSNPDVSEEALMKIVDQNAQRLEDYKKKQESYFHSMINNMHQNMSNAAGRSFPAPGGAFPAPGGAFPRLPNQIGMGPRGPIIARPLRGAVPGAMPGMRPNILKSNARTATAADMIRRMGPLTSRGGMTGARPPIPRPPGGPDAPGSSATTPIEI